METVTKRFTLKARVSYGKSNDREHDIAVTCNEYITKKNSPLPTKAQSIKQFCFLRERLKSNAGKMSDLIFWVYLRQGYPV